MFAYVARRILLMLPTLLGITVVVFLLVNLVPGGPIEQAIQRARGIGAGETGGGGASRTLPPEALAQLRAYYGFDQPLPVRYVKWVSKVVRLDLGRSYNYRQDVWKLIRARIPISLLFGGTGFVLAYLVCIPLGIYKAMHHGTWKDTLTSSAVFVGYAIPEFALGVVLLVLFGGGSFWSFFPLSGVTSDNFAHLSLVGKVLDVLHHMVLPLVCYTIGSFATLTILMKNTLMDNLSADYVRTALAKGLGFRAALYRHALRNSLIPLATGFGAILTVFVSGSILIEVVFGIDGMGKLSYDALFQRDYPVTLGVILVLSVLTLLGNLVSDVLYVLIDPRISFDRSAD